MLVAIENSFFMIESSFSIGPKSESLREQLISPFSLVLSPGLWPESSECLELATEEIPRCSNCGTYFSKFSSNVGKKYTCSTCMHNEEVSEDKFIPNLENYQVKLNDSVGEEINVIYISLDFNNKDLKLILGSVCIMLKHLNNKNVIVMVGDNVSPFSFLTPAISCFEMDDDGKIMINEDRRKEINKDDHFMAPICHIFDDSINITKFIFVPEQIQCIINTLKNIKPVSVEVPLVYLYNAITLLNNHSGNSIIHFISILSIFNDENKDYKEILKSLYYKAFRFDIFTPTLTKDLKKMLMKIPGLVTLFDGDNLPSKLISIINENSIYQYNMKVRINDCSKTWNKTPYPYMEINQDFLFAPVLPYQEQPFILNLHPKGQNDSIIVQITSNMIIYYQKIRKYISVLRIINKKIYLSDNLEEVLNSININSLAWLWIIRSLDNPQNEVISAFFRSTAYLYTLLNQNEEKAKKLIQCCCSLRFSNIMSKDIITRIISRYIICLISPSHYSMYPVLDSTKKVYYFGDSIYCENKDNQVAFEISLKTPYITSIHFEIPDWCIRMNKSDIDKLNKILSE